MLSVQRLALTYSFQRMTSRCITSVVCERQIDNFGVKNEPILPYLKDSRERCQLEAALKCVQNCVEEIPIVIGDKQYKTTECRYQVIPHFHKKKIAKFYYATPDLIRKAIKSSVEAQKEWDKTPLSERLNIWEKAANLMATTYRQTLNATTMLGQSKTIIQAEIDSACEIVDFFRFNAYFMKEYAKYQPISENPKVTLNTLRYRGLDGFVAAISPFNFTAIAGNLAYAPVLIGNAVVWKPSDTAMLSNWTVFKICKEAGVPPGVVNFVPAHGPDFGDTVTSSKHLAGINFTGSVPTFSRLWKQVSGNIGNYISFPRLLGECGGKNYHFIHPSADVKSVVAATIRSAFELCGQKCSACSRMYVPESLWCEIKEGLLETRKMLKVGDVTEYDTFMGAVIDENAFNRIKSYIDEAKNPPHCILGGGRTDKSCGYFVEPTIVQTTDPKSKLMTEEIFGPVLAIYVYKDNEIDNIIDLINTSTPYALTGAVFAQNEKFLKYALEALKMSAGNFYINDKSTGAVVGQQPFGGSRMSGTNDKAGGPHYVLRWGNPQAIKETFQPVTDVLYPYMCQ